MDDVDKELLKKAELGNEPLTESSMEDLVIDVPSSMEESPLLSQEQQILQPSTGHSPNQDTPCDETHDLDYSRDIIPESIPDSPNMTPDQDCSRNSYLDQDLLRDALPEQDDMICNQELSHERPSHIDELIMTDGDHLPDDLHNTTDVNNLPSPDYSPIFQSPDHSSLTDADRSITPLHSSPDHSELSFSSQGQSRSPNLSKAPWNAYLSPSTIPSPDPDPLALPPKDPSLQKFPAIYKSLTMPALRTANETYSLRVRKDS